MLAKNVNGIMKFGTTTSPHCAVTVGYKGKYTAEIVSSKFLGLHLDNHLNWKEHIDQMIPKLSAACYAVRSMLYISNSNTLKSIYFAYFHSILQYGIIFWGNSSTSRRIFTLHKKIIGIMLGAHPRTPCRNLFKKLESLPVPCQYIFSLMNFFVNNQENIQTTPSVHSINTRNKDHLHRPIANLSCFQKSAFYSGIKIFNRLPHSLTNIKNERCNLK
jgi:IS1 family transposase